MELVERYLQAVKFWLPKQQKHDIIAELSEDIHAQIEEKEAELGHSLNESEVEAILRQRGAPVLVANRYLPQEHLIGPLLFPIYRLVLKIVALCYLVPWVLVWLGLTIYGPVDPAGPGPHSWTARLGAMWGSFWVAAFVTLGIVTVIFAILERTQAKSRFLEKWDPRKLPPVRDPNQTPRSSSIIELVVNLVFCAWWAGYMASPIVLSHPGIQITMSPLWPWFYWGFLLLALCNTALAGANLMRPYATSLRATFRLLSDLAGSALFCWMLKANILGGIVIANVSAAKALEITNAINWWTAKMFPAAIVACVVILVVNAFRVVRVTSNRAPLARAAAMILTLLVLVGALNAQTKGRRAHSFLPASSGSHGFLAVCVNVQHRSLGVAVEIAAPIGAHISAHGGLSQDVEASPGAGADGETGAIQ